MIDLNSLLIGGVGIGIMSTVFHTIKGYGQWLFSYSTRYFVTRLRVNGEDAVYHSLNAWFNQTDYAKNCSILELGSKQPGNQIDGPILNPGPGLHWFKANDLRILMIKTDSPKMGDGSVGQTRIKTIDLTIFSRNKDKIKQLFQDISESLETQQNTVKVYRTSYGSLSSPKFLTKRPISSVFLDKAIKDKLIKDLDWFISAQKFFQAHHIPYKRGYLFQGKPGTGKTSLVHAIASEYGYSIVNLSMGDLSSGELQGIINNLPPKALILIEDVDAIFTGRKNEQKQQNGVSFNDFINMLDGFDTKYGQIVILTTNHPEKLDPALCRSGRMDFVLNFDFASEEVITTMIKSFTNHPKIFEEITSKLATETTTAQLQEILLERFGYKNDI